MRKLSRIFCGICLLLLTILIFPSVLLAQSARGTLAGDIADSSGAVISGARIVAVSTDTGSTNETVSTSSGNYRFPELAIGRYDVTVSAKGFSTTTSKGVPVTINSTAVLNVVLKPGVATETVIVDASAPTIESQTSDISGTISQQQINELPLSLATGVGGLRSPEAFAFLVPGTTGPGTGVPTGLNSNGVWLMKIGGGQSFGSETLLDGASIERSENGSSFDETSPSIEALQEFKVTTSLPSAEFGRTTGGFESFATRNGTNDFHGTAFFFIKNAAFDANNWFNNGYKVQECSGVSKGCAYDRPQDSKFDYGGTFSGPIRLINPFKRKNIYNGRDKTFFFFAWEQYKLSLGAVTTSTVPTTTGGSTGTGEAGGDFSALLGSATSLINPCTGEQVLQNQIFDPATTTTGPTGIPCRLPFAGNIIPTGRFSSAAKGLMAGLPGPNQAPTSSNQWGFAGNYSNYSVDPTYNTTFTVRIDQSLSEKSKIFGSYSSRDNWRVLGYTNLPIPFNNSGYPQDFQTHYIRGGWDYVLTPSLLNHLSIGYNRTNSKNYAYQIGSSQNLTAVGAPNFYSNAFPVVTWDGLDQFSNWGVGNNGDNIDNGPRISDSVSWQHGSHSFKFGVDWRHQQYSVIQLSIPQINFLRSETDVAALGGSPQLESGNSLASFMLGMVDNGNQTVYNHNPRWNSHYIAGFAQDDWKVTPYLTLNLGIRYDVDTPRHEAENLTSNFSFTAPDAAAGNLPGALVFGKTCHCNSAWADTWMKDVAPRVGFAYMLPGSKGKSVIRGGAGIIYGPLQYADFGGSMTQGYNIYNWVGSFYTGPGTAAGFTPAFNLDQGESTWTKSFFSPNTDPTQLTGSNGNFDNITQLIRPNNGRPAMTTEWNLQIQQEVAQDLIFTLGYIGQTAQNLRSGYLTNANNISDSYFYLGDHMSDTGSQIANPGGSVTVKAENGTTLTVNAPYPTFMGNLGQALRPYKQYGYIAGDCCMENVGHASYNAMVATLNRRFRQGFNLQISYTWSKNETDSDSQNPWQYDSYRSQTQYMDLRKEKAVSVQNTPQALSISYLYQLPFGKGRQFLNHNRLLDYAIGGWELGGIQRYQSGQPIDFGCATGTAYYQNCFRFTRGPAAAGAGGFASAAYKKNKNGPSYFNQQSWFKPAFRPAGTNGTTDPGVPLSEAAFIDMNRSSPGNGWFRKPSAACADGCSYDPIVYGTGISRVTEEITGPILLSEDFSLLKNFAITEKLRFVFKAEAIDAFNRHRMGLPDTEPGDSSGSYSFGVPSSVDYGPRNLQFSGRITF